MTSSQISPDPSLGPVHFWREFEVPHGFMSQWYESSFEVEGVTYVSAEMWMMVQKALLFGDGDVARRTLAITGDMRAVKALGRAVRNFDEVQWAAHRERIVYEGNLEKFRQNPELWAKLDATGDSVIVEASPRDRIWGIGIGEKRAVAEGEGAWRGQNLLGVAIGRTRDTLRKEAKAKEPSTSGTKETVVETKEVVEETRERPSKRAKR